LTITRQQKESFPGGRRLGKLQIGMQTKMIKGFPPPLNSLA